MKKRQKQPERNTTKMLKNISYNEEIFEEKEDMAKEILEMFQKYTTRIQHSNIKYVDISSLYPVKLHSSVKRCMNMQYGKFYTKEHNTWRNTIDNEVLTFKNLTWLKLLFLDDGQLINHKLKDIHNGISVNFKVSTMMLHDNKRITTFATCSKKLLNKLRGIPKLTGKILLIEKVVNGYVTDYKVEIQNDFVKPDYITFRNANRLKLLFLDDGQVKNMIYYGETNDRDITNRFDFKVSTRMANDNKRLATFSTSSKRLLSKLKAIPKLAGKILLIEKVGVGFSTEYVVDILEDMKKPEPNLSETIGEHANMEVFIDKLFNGSSNKSTIFIAFSFAFGLMVASLILTTFFVFGVF